MIATASGKKTVLGPKRPPNALHGVVSAMDGVMAPPSAAIVPEMMVLIVIKDTDGEGDTHRRRSWIQHDGMKERFVSRLGFEMKRTKTSVAIHSGRLR